MSKEKSITPQQALKAFRTLWPSVQKMRKRTDASVVIYRDQHPESEIIFLSTNRIAWGELRICQVGDLVKAAASQAAGEGKTSV